MNTEIEREVESLRWKMDQQEGGKKPATHGEAKIGGSFLARNRHAIWRLVVIATLTLGLGAILLPIAACM